MARLDDSDIELSGSELEDSGDETYEPNQGGDHVGNDDDSSSTGKSSDDGEDEPRPSTSSAKPAKEKLPKKSKVLK